jgi:hypothetical protein
MAKGDNTDQNSSRSQSQNQNPMMTSPMQIIQSQLGLTPQQLQVLMHHHQQQQQQLAFQSVSKTYNYEKNTGLIRFRLDSKRKQVKRTQNKGGAISEDIFNLVLSSKQKRIKLLSLNFLL